MEKPTAAESPRKRRSPPRHRKPLDLKNTPVTPPPDSAPEASPIAPLSAARHAGPTADSPTPDAATPRNDFHLSQRMQTESATLADRAFALTVDT